MVAGETAQWVKVCVALRATTLQFPLLHQDLLTLTGNANCLVSHASGPPQSPALTWTSPTPLHTHT